MPAKHIRRNLIDVGKRNLSAALHLKNTPEHLISQRVIVAQHEEANILFMPTTQGPDHGEHVVVGVLHQLSPKQFAQANRHQIRRLRPVLRHRPHARGRGIEWLWIALRDFDQPVVERTQRGALADQPCGIGVKISGRSIAAHGFIFRSNVCRAIDCRHPASAAAIHASSRQSRISPCTPTSFAPSPPAHADGWQGGSTGQSNSGWRRCLLRPNTQSQDLRTAHQVPRSPSHR